MGAGAIHGHQDPNQQCTSQTSSPEHSTAGSNSSRHQEDFNVTLPTTNTSTAVKNNHSMMKMSCEKCSSNFTLFKRKKFCRECHRYFCSTCLPKPPSSSPAGRQCQKCLLLISGHFTRDDLQDWKIKDIRCFLDVRKVSTKGCREKHDLVELVLSQFCKERRSSLERQAEHDLFVQQMAAHLTLDDARDSTTPTQEGSNEASGTSTDTTRGDSSGSPTTRTPGEIRTDPGDGGDCPDRGRFNRMSSQEFRNFLQSQVEELLNAGLSQRDTGSLSESSPSPKPVTRMHLEEVQTMEDIDLLSVRQLKELLVNNFVDFKGCCEKPELIQRVKRLWTDHQDNKIRAERIHKADEDAATASSSRQKLTVDESTAPVPDTEDVREESIEVSQEDPPTPDTTPLEKAGSDSSLSTSPSKLAPEGPAAPPTGEVTDSLCRVCMDSLTNCILLECGHMVTCTTCGKQLAECPICRQYISRVVRVFRS